MGEIMLDQTEPIIAQSLKDLKNYVALASVSAKQQAQKQTAQFIKQLLEDRLDATVQLFNDYQAPLVFAQLQPKQPSETTILIYNHYDVQPEEPLDLWQSDPFILRQTAQQLFGRGVADCKGDFISRLAALQLYYQEHHDWPCNIKFLLEGEEEIASQHLGDYLAKYHDLLAADLILWESGAKNEFEQFTIEGGNKGVLCFELTAVTADIDLHSSYAAVVDSAAWRLVEAIKSLRSVDGQIKIPGFYDEVVPPSVTEELLVQENQVPNLTNKWNLQVPLLQNKSINYNLAFAPTINIEGLSGGWQGSGVKTVTPKQAQAKLEFRLVPDQDPQVIFDKLTTYLASQGFTDIKVQYLLGEKAYRWDLQSDMAQKLITTAKQFYGDQQVAVLPSSAGTGPMHLLHYYTQADILSCGVGYSKSGPHAPNENIRLRDYLEFIEFFVDFLNKV
ncbi:M20/M25/M40 family metallo-hydrolase [Bombilactobacillus thymidiniphilus]|uniref:M20/M25/M40 family metallo-hydrolase n=1 Tax=Bombilactobacillus thymidiniphilus TaxID=2923363 RepID=A0ABY4PD46_9LACO|nr:M20/M25/M40 family metallo-hydrolase [Bombilactobacillus thymidiniphilus]UQS83698.1 M20/M25/M40 family metallo-hydrolase [Bombilactobacillus thymidiniphilus]